MQLADIAATWRAVAATGSRTAKTAQVADALRVAGPDLRIAVPWLSGELRQRRTGIGGASLRDMPPPARAPSLSVREVDDAFETAAGLSGAGSAAARTTLVRDIFGRATEDEQALLRGLISGELRQGALDAVVVAAIALATELPVADVRRAAMLSGALAPVAVAAFASGANGLAGFGLTVGRPVRPMLAATATSVTDAIATHSGMVAIDAKLDGIRAQVHRSGADVAVFSRSLDNITGRVPEIVSAVRALPVDSVIIDGEALGIGPDGRPLAFQDTGSQAASRAVDVEKSLRLFAFDALHLNGEDLIDLPLGDRISRLQTAASHLIVDRVETADPEVAAQFAERQLALGHEGVVVKALDSVYDAGRRGSAWLKVKPVRTVDLIVTAVEWGHGRRKGLLSNLHLAARGPDGSPVMVGKTFKGMTDAMLRWQTETFQALATEANEWVVHVTPTVVVEIGYDAVQRSTRYPGGVALRFARVLRYRPDKSAAEADPIELLQSQLPG